jgi:hypothetical protein
MIVASRSPLDSFLCMKRWLLLSLLLVSLSVAVVLSGYKADLKQFEPTLIALNVTIAALAINFSFVAYQSSEYRQFQRGLSPSLLFGCIVLLIWAVTPALVLVFARPFVGVIGLAVLPITALCSVGLVALAKREAGPNPIIKQASKKRRRRRTLSEYARKVDSTRKEWEQLSLTTRPEMATHERDWILQPVMPSNDPFSVLGAIGSIAAENCNIEGMALATQGLLSALDEALLLLQPDGRPLLHKVIRLIESPLKQIAVAAEDADPTTNVSSHFLDVCGRYFGSKCSQGWPVEAACFPVADLMLDSAKRWIKQGKFDAARTPLVVIRQACFKGMDRWSSEPTHNGDDHSESLFWPPHLGRLAQMMKPLGTCAIEIGGEDGSKYLYHVLGAFGWLGCSAMKMRHNEVVTVCVRALAQLGREARARKLECHWDRCALEPHQHAEESIDWILTWLMRLPHDERGRWLGIFAQGYSRLLGSVVNIEIVDSGEKRNFEKKISSTAHKETFASYNGVRELDYCNFSMLKDFELHGHMGGVFVRGPIVPLTTTNNIEERADERTCSGPE